MLKPVSETMIERGHRGHLYPKKYDVGFIADLMDLGVFEQGIPHKDFARMRRDAPIYWNEESGDAEGFWSVMTHAEVCEVGRNQQIYSNQIGGHQITSPPEATRMRRLWSAAMDNMINLDGKPHLELRRQHMPFFRPSYIAELRTRVRAKVTELLNDMADRGGSCDLVHVFSAELPLFTLSKMLGVPDADRPRLAEWMEYIELAPIVQSNRMTGDQQLKYADFGARFIDKMNEMLDYGSYMIKSRRSDPKEDLFTAIANATVEGAQLSDEYVNGTWLLILNGGNDTTRNTISGSVQLFTDFPDQRRLLIGDDSLISNAVHEAVRHISPVLHMRRTATEDTELGGQKIAKGEKVVMWYPSANRDETVFAHPDRFDITRENASKHVAFGFGSHVCIGQLVATMQLEEVYRQLLKRFPDIVVSGEVDIAPNNFTYGIRHMPVSYTV
jgi:cytochrome P450